MNLQQLKSMLYDARFIKIVEVLNDYNNEYGNMDLSDGKVKIYARLAFFAIVNYGSFREDIEERIEEINNIKSAATTEEEW